jgi:predicted dinucleotide-binding enzyme
MQRRFETREPIGLNSKKSTAQLTIGGYDGRMAKTIGILGTGSVGQALGKGFKNLGHAVMIGSRDGKQVDGWDGEVGTFKDVAAGSEIIVLSVKGTAAEEVVRSIWKELAGKLVIDTTNPIADEVPDDNVLHYFTTLEDSLMERLQDIAADAKFVKAFNSVGSSSMINPTYENGPPTMFICGNDEDAKASVTKILDEFGWEIADFGGVKSARAIEPLCMLWCIPGMMENMWSHAFKMLRK